MRNGQNPTKKSLGLVKKKDIGRLSIHRQTNGKIKRQYKQNRLEENKMQEDRMLKFQVKYFQLNQINSAQD